jgi:hypothetical protein
LHVCLYARFCFVVCLFCLTCRPCWPKHVVEDSENQHNKDARRRKHNLQNPLKKE